MQSSVLGAEEMQVFPTGTFFTSQAVSRQLGEKEKAQKLFLRGDWSPLQYVPAFMNQESSPRF